MSLWAERDHFGIGQVEKSWLVSLLQRLRDVSKLSIDDVLNDRRLADAMRFHPINWSAKEIPVGLSDIDWLEGAEKEPDFEMLQFHISKALGRVVGFFDKNSVFQIVLFDPFHNIQPSKDFDYRVRATYPSRCQYTSYHAAVQTEIMACSLSEDEKQRILFSLQDSNKRITGLSVVVDIKSETLNEYYALLAKGTLLQSANDVFELGLAEVKKMLAE